MTNKQTNTGNGRISFNRIYNKIYQVNLPNGEIATRKSKRTYTHAVAVLFNEHDYWANQWGIVGFCGTPELANKLSNQWKSYKNAKEVRILPVEVKQ